VLYDIAVDDGIVTVNGGEGDEGNAADDAEVRLEHYGGEALPRPLHSGINTLCDLSCVYLGT
jgi:hypothetical protein